MRCRLCRAPAGWFRRRCRACATLWAVYASRLPGTGLREMLAAFESTGVAPAHIERFLQADPDGTGSIQDHLAADVANQLLHALGSSAQQTPGQVKELRARGAWRSYDRPPED